MANITLQDLQNVNLIGTDLFDDPESFMKDLADDEFGTQGEQTTPNPNKINLTPILDPLFTYWTCIA